MSPERIKAIRAACQRTGIRLIQKVRLPEPEPEKPKTKTSRRYSVQRAKPKGSGRKPHPQAMQICKAMKQPGASYALVARQFNSDRSSIRYIVLKYSS